MTCSKGTVGVVPTSALDMPRCRVHCRARMLSLCAAPRWVRLVPALLLVLPGGCVSRDAAPTNGESDADGCGKMMPCDAAVSPPATASQTPSLDHQGDLDASQPAKPSLLDAASRPPPHLGTASGSDSTSGSDTTATDSTAVSMDTATAADTSADTAALDATGTDAGADTTDDPEQTQALPSEETSGSTASSSSSAPDTPDASAGSDAGADTATPSGGEDTTSAQPHPEDAGQSAADAATEEPSTQATASCSDEVHNGNESDTDCGGSCPACDRGASCFVAADCSPATAQACVNATCVSGPVANFSLSVVRGKIPLDVELISSARPGDAPLAMIEYDFGYGEGFTTALHHRYETAGSFVIVQQVTDGNGLVSRTSHTVVAEVTTPTSVHLNPLDRQPEDGLTLGPDGLTVDITTGDPAGIRSELAIQPGSGFFYFEGERLGEPLFQFYFGLVTAGFELGEAPGEDGQSIGVDIGGSVEFGASTIGEFSNETRHYGFAIDYRQMIPTVHVISSESHVLTAVMDAVDAPLYIYLGGRRVRVGPQARVNTGNDTTNAPFHYDAQRVLAKAGIDSTDLVMGFGQSHAAAPNTAPKLTLAAPPSAVVGSQVSLQATAWDVEDGEVSDSVSWSDLATTYGERVRGSGKQWTFVPRVPGLHPIEATVRDSDGREAVTVVDVRVEGSLPRFDTVELVTDERSGAGVQISDDGLAARFTAFGKYGVRANQGLLNGFEYFEMRRLGNIENQGGGVVTLDGDLNPYRAANVPPSCSINHSASIWRSLVSVADYDTHATDHYGVVVDYRARHPTVFFITENSSGEPVLAHAMVLDDVTVPVYPMVYGNPTPAPSSSFDVEINFGGQPFYYDPVLVLNDAGYDSTGLRLGWGSAARE